MKTTVFLTLLLWAVPFNQVGAQTTAGRLAVTRPNAPTVGDSINSGQCICLDTTVTSFMVTIIYRGGGACELRCAGNCSQLLYQAKSGTKVVCSEIVSEPQSGVRVRLPVRTFYVR